MTWHTPVMGVGLGLILFGVTDCRVKATNDLTQREAGWKACAAMCAERPLKVSWHPDGSLASCECDAVPFVETE